MTKFFDAMDDWFGHHSLASWALTAVLIALVMWLDWMTKTTTAMLLLAIPGIYIMGRKGGMVRVVKFGLCMALAIFVLASVANQIPCNDFGRGFWLFYGVTCQ